MGAAPAPLKRRPAHRLRLGEPLAILPLLHYTLLKYSRHVAGKIVQLGYQVGSRHEVR
jgi:centrosomal protein CEP44